MEITGVIEWVVTGSTYQENHQYYTDLELAVLGVHLLLFLLLSGEPLTHIRMHCTHYYTCSHIHAQDVDVQPKLQILLYILSSPPSSSSSSGA